MPGEDVSLTHYLNSELKNCCKTAAVRVTCGASPYVFVHAVSQKPVRVQKMTGI